MDPSEDTLRDIDGRDVVLLADRLWPGYRHQFAGSTGLKRGAYSVRALQRPVRRHYGDRQPVYETLFVGTTREALAWLRGHQSEREGLSEPSPTTCRSCGQTACECCSDCGALAGADHLRGCRLDPAS